MPKATDDTQLHRATAAFMLLTGTGDSTDWMDVLDSELGRNRPNQEILVPDWLITSHVT